MSSDEGGWSLRTKALVVSGTVVLGAAVGAALLIHRWRTTVRIGKKTLVNGTQTEVYEGELVGGCANGTGRSRTADGDVCEGTWKNDLPWGACVMRFAAGHRFEGTILASSAVSGQWDGVFTYANGATMQFKGMMQDSGLTGTCTVTDSTGVVHFRGQWKNGREDGVCMQVASNGDVYEGNFVAGKRQGEGKLVSHTGNVFEGNWEDGEKSGQGKMTYADGSTYEGTWKAGSWDTGVVKDPAKNATKQVVDGKTMKNSH